MPHRLPRAMPGRWCTCPCHAQEAAAEWLPDAGTFEAPTGPEEAEALELGGRVAVFRSHQSLLFNDPAGGA